ncbi:ferritin-like domain-containing protein [Actinoplanes sp. KI2]|uniref:ferritin-like domain-containing protein n=1 Tax=Actinoplanes sp. KI2 TaxID=2983315 RepID=UPI0021D5FB81|nr:ferritin-like domain-containing protein [Actinoplanes sp. KI2]MCU7723753.1 ferritin-like domain-containing protein [Actinoplanes sp. KI2]
MNQQLAAAMAAEEAAIYAYGILGVHLVAPAQVAEARAAETAHRNRRDYLLGQIDQPPAAAAGYDLPFPVADPVSAVRLAVHVEDGVAQSWRPVLGASQGAARAAALSALTDAAVRATRWRRIAALSPVTMPYPGKAA